jgi:hypothetical protein
MYLGDEMDLHQNTSKEIIGIFPTSLCFPKPISDAKGQEDIGDHIGGELGISDVHSRCVDLHRLEEGVGLIV